MNRSKRNNAMVSPPYLADKFGKAELTGIVRQHEESIWDAVKQFAKGEAGAALKQYELAGSGRAYPLAWADSN